MASVSKKSGFTSALLKWYDSNVRPFPWRSTADPYRVWLSEIMLQQTQVKIVIPYYKRWLRDLSNVGTVANVLSSDGGVWNVVSAQSPPIPSA